MYGRSTAAPQLAKITAKPKLACPTISSAISTRPISRSLATQATPSSTGAGDTNLGIKWNFRRDRRKFPSPRSQRQLLRRVPHRRSAQSTRLRPHRLLAQLHLPGTDHGQELASNLNLGVLFAGNTSTGAVGINTTRGQVYTSSLSVLHDINARLIRRRRSLRRRRRHRRPRPHATARNGRRLRSRSIQA